MSFVCVADAEKKIDALLTKLPKQYRGEVSEVARKQISKSDEGEAEFVAEVDGVFGGIRSKLSSNESLSDSDKIRLIADSYEIEAEVLRLKGVTSGWELAESQVEA